MNTRRVVLPVIAAVLLLAGCTQPADTLRPLVAPKPTEGIVIYVAGDVEAMTGTSSVAVEPGDRVGAGTTIITKADSYCEMQFGTVSVRVEPDTQFQCGRVAIGDKTAAVSGTLTAGAILAKVKKLTGSDLQVQTPAAVVGVRGTAFKVSVSGNVTTVTVSEGTVNVTRDGTTVDVGEGQRAEAAPGADMTPEPAAAEDLEAIDAFEQLSVDTSRIQDLVKVVVEVPQPNGQIIRVGVPVGLKNWGALLEPASQPQMIVVRVDGYADEPVFLPNEGGKPVRIRPNLKRSSASRGQPAPGPASPTPSPGRAPSSTPSPSPTPAPTSTPAAASTSAPGQAGGAQKKGDPPAYPPRREIDMVFFARMWKLFAEKEKPGFSFEEAVQDKDVFIGIDARTGFTYDELRQQAGAGRLRPVNIGPVLITGNLRDAVKVGGVMYGVPIAGATPVMYYDTNSISEGPGDLRELSDERYRLAMPRFDPVLMGMFLEARGIELVVPGSPPSTHLATPRAEGTFQSLRELFDRLDGFDKPKGSVPVGLLSTGRTNLLIDESESFGILRNAFGENRVGVAQLPSWERSSLIPYARVYALFAAAGTGTAGRRAEMIEKFCLFLLRKRNQIELVDAMLRAGAPVAPALNFQNDTGWLTEKHIIVSILYEQLKTAGVVLHQPGASAALRAYRDVLDDIEKDRSNEELVRLAERNFRQYLSGQ